MSRQRFRNRLPTPAGCSEVAVSPRRPSKTPQQLASQGHRSGKVALLSFFDGIGSAHQVSAGPSDTARRFMVVGARRGLSQSGSSTPPRGHPAGRRDVRRPSEGGHSPQGAVSRLHVCSGLMCTAVPGFFADDAAKEGQKFAQWIHQWWRPFQKACKLKFALLLENVVRHGQGDPGDA